MSKKKPLKDAVLEAELISRRYVKIREKMQLLSVCYIIQELGEVYGVLEETDRAYWVPDWFFMATWPPASRGKKELAADRAHKAMFDEKYRKSLETKYGIIRKLQADNKQTGMWE